MIPATQSSFRERWFRAYLRWELPRCFHTVHLTGSLGEFVNDSVTPLLVCLNHTSWWDVLIAYYLEMERFGWERYSVMDERQLRRYRFFSKMGMIGVDRTSVAGARDFLTYATTLLNGRSRSLWLTPQGELVSNYARPITFQSGLAHLAGRLNRFYFTTVAVHYEFWDERLPEAFVSLSPIECFAVDGAFDRKGWQTAQETRLAQQMDGLLALVEKRDASLFEPLLRGSAGVNILYDGFRSLRARLAGETFRAAHGDVKTPPLSRPSKKPPGS